MSDEVEANLEQQVEEAAVLHAICGADLMVLAPLAADAAGNGSGRADGGDGDGAAGSSGPGSGSSACEDTSRWQPGEAAAGVEEAPQVDVAALRAGEALEAQVAIHVQLPPDGLGIQARGLQRIASHVSITEQMSRLPLVKRRCASCCQCWPAAAPPASTGRAALMRSHSAGDAPL